MHMYTTKYTLKYTLNCINTCIHSNTHSNTHLLLTPPFRYLLLSVTTGCLPANRLWYIDLASLPVNPDTGALVLDNAADKVWGCFVSLCRFFLQVCVCVCVDMHPCVYPCVHCNRLHTSTHCIDYPTQHTTHAYTLQPLLTPAPHPLCFISHIQTHLPTHPPTHSHQIKTKTTPPPTHTHTTTTPIRLSSWLTPLMPNTPTLPTKAVCLP